MNERIEQIKAAMADEAFVNACIDAENEAAVQKLFAGKGIEMSLTEIEILKEMVCAVADGRVTEEQLEQLSKAGELSEDELEQAAGGGLGDVIRNSFGSVGSIGNEVLERLSEGSSGMSEGVRQSFTVGEKLAATFGAGVMIATVVVVGAGIANMCGVDVGGGISSAYNWCKEKITSRW
ncbi:MAG: hypothetical protein IKN55_10915 [Oscillospiraceae bacterium]|nr:hypothetical protein [Oscillospiraceae bacterium]